MGSESLKEEEEQTILDPRKEKRSRLK